MVMCLHCGYWDTRYILVSMWTEILLHFKSANGFTTFPSPCRYNKLPYQLTEFPEGEQCLRSKYVNAQNFNIPRPSDRELTFESNNVIMSTVTSSIVNFDRMAMLFEDLILSEC